MIWTIRCTDDNDLGFSRAVLHIISLNVSTISTHTLDYEVSGLNLPVVRLVLQCQDLALLWIHELAKREIHPSEP